MTTTPTPTTTPKALREEMRARVERLHERAESTRAQGLETLALRYSVEASRAERALERLESGTAWSVRA